jgi:hypothetical protein
MRKKLLAISLVFLIVCIISGWERLYGQSVWKTYVKLLNRMYPGLTPYKMPNPADGPGTIFFIDKKGVEQLYFDQKKAFPDLELQQPVNVPSANLSEMSNMQFKIGISAGDQKILTNEVNLAAGLAITKDTYVTVTVANPMIHRAQDGLINLKITKFDIRNPIHEDILKKLQESNSIIISGSLHVDSLVYTFHRTSTIDSALDASLNNNSMGFNITYKKITDTEFSLEARSPMFWAYYAYPIDRGQMEQLYKDKLKIKELEDAGEYRVQEKSLNATKDQNIKEIELLKKKKYNLFGKKVIIPVEIREESYK